MTPFKLKEEVVIFRDALKRDKFVIRVILFSLADCESDNNKADWSICDCFFEIQI